jgi:hypothetical protein
MSYPLGEKFKVNLAPEWQTGIELRMSETEIIKNTSA